MRSADNLLRPGWSDVDPDELQQIIQFAFRRGQLAEDGDAVFPEEGDACRVRIQYKGGEVAAVVRGPAFDADEWDRLAKQIEEDLLAWESVYASAIVFSAYPVERSWRSDKLGVQILPAPPKAPRPDMGLGDYPFVLEFPVRKSANWYVTNRRRQRQYRRFALALNALFEGKISASSSSPRHLWAFIPNTGEVAWVQEGYSVGSLEPYRPALSDFSGEPIEVVPDAQYYARFGLRVGRSLEVPASLEMLLALWDNLSPNDRERFGRASYWLDAAERIWPLSRSASFTAMVTAVEALINDPPTMGLCPDCQRPMGPGPTKMFRDFVERYAPGGGKFAVARGQTLWAAIGS